MLGDGDLAGMQLLFDAGDFLLDVGHICPDAFDLLQQLCLANGELLEHRGDLVVGRHGGRAKETSHKMEMEIRWSALH